MPKLERIERKIKKLEEKKKALEEEYRKKRAKILQSKLKSEEKAQELYKLYQKYQKRISEIDTRILILKREASTLPLKEEMKKRGRIRLKDIVKAEREILKSGIPTTLEEPLVQMTIPESYEIIEQYSVHPPYAYIAIGKDKFTNEMVYFVIEPRLSPRETDLLNLIKDIIVSSIVVYPEEVGENKWRFIEELVERIVSDYGISMTRASLEKIKYYVSRDFAGYGRIDPIMRDPWIEDISCDGPGIPIFVFHRKYQSLRTNVVFPEALELDNFVIRLAQISGKHISVANPLLDTTLPDGSRAQLTLRKEVTTKGSTFTIRKFREKPFSPVELIELETASPEMMAYFWILVEYGASAIFAGGTASGKTTSLNATTMFIPPNEKIVSIEDTRELNLPHPNWIPGVTRTGFGGEGKEIDMYDLLRAALRQRPRYIIVGEVRGREAYVMFQAMATGHTTYSTFHAESARALVHRFTQEPMNIPRIMFSSLDAIIIQKFVRIKGRPYRKMAEVVEIADVDPTTMEILTNKPFLWNPETNDFEYTGKSKVFERFSRMTGISEEAFEDEMARRTKILEWMLSKGIRDYKEVSTIIFTYYNKPEDILEKVFGRVQARAELREKASESV